MVRLIEPTPVQAMFPFTALAVKLPQQDFFGYEHGDMLHGSEIDVGPLKVKFNEH